MNIPVRPERAKKIFFFSKNGVRFVGQSKKNADLGGIQSNLGFVSSARSIKVDNSRWMFSPKSGPVEPTATKRNNNNNKKKPTIPHYTTITRFFFVNNNLKNKTKQNKRNTVRFSWINRFSPPNIPIMHTSINDEYYINQRAQKHLRTAALETCSLSLSLSLSL